jgi:hypothetical protein
MKLVSPELQAGGKRARYTTLYGPWALLFIIVAGTSALFAVVTKLGDGVASGRNDSIFYCDSSGKVRYRYSSVFGTSPYWDSRLFLSVTMGVHGLTFGQAKAMDIGFDLVAGRGSQVLLALAIYPILRRSILRSMEVREFSLALLMPFFLERLSVFSLWAMFANMRSRRTKPKTNDQTEQIQFRKARVRVDWRVVLVFLVGCYVLALPTVTSVMTSYQVRSAPFLPDGLGYVSTTEIENQIPDFILGDGDPVGLSENYPMYNDTDNDVLSTCLACKSIVSTEKGVPLLIIVADRKAYQETVVKILDNTTHRYNQAVYSDDLHDDDSRRAAFERVRESLPSKQNVTDQNDPPLWSFTFWPRDRMYLDSEMSLHYNNTDVESTIVINNVTYNLSSGQLYLYRNLLPGQGGPGPELLFAYKNVSITSQDILAGGKCLPGNDYIWGFSSLMLFTFCMITIAVALLLMTLHYDAYFNSAADRYKLSISPYRDVLDLAEELRAHYGSAGTAEMPAKELDRAMREDPVATGLETDTLHRSRRARWKQAKASKKSFTRSDARKRTTVAGGKAATDAEESLMSLGFDAQLHSEMEMAKLPARVASRSSNGT